MTDITVAQIGALRLFIYSRRVTDDGLIYGGLPDGVRWPTARALNRLGMLDFIFPDATGVATRNAVRYRVTEKGHAAVRMGETRASGCLR